MLVIVTIIKTFHLNRIKETSGDVGESDHDGKVNEHLVHDDTYNSVDADNRDKNQDVSLEEDKNTSGNVRNDSGKQLRVMAEKVIMMVKLMNLQVRMIQAKVYVLVIVTRMKTIHLKRIKRQVASLEMIQEKQLLLMAEKLIMTVNLMNIQFMMIKTIV